MLNKLRSKWYLLVVGGCLAFSLGQCVADFLEDVIIFSIVD